MGRYLFNMIHSDHFCVVAILRLRAVRRLQKLNASLGHANREAERPVGARAVHPRGGPIFVHGFLEDYAVYAVLAKKKSSTFGVLFFLWSLHASMQIFVAKKNRARQLEQTRASSRIFQDCSPRLPYDVSLRFFSA